MRRHIIYILLLMMTVAVKAQVVKGTVYDEKGEPMPSVAIFQKSSPADGVLSDQDGKFELQLKPSTGDKIVVSFISYKTKEYAVETVTGKNIAIRMEEQPIMLDEAVVKAKLSKTQEKKIKKAVLERFRDQLKVDFPQTKHRFEIYSAYSGKKDNRELMRHEIVAVMNEYPVKRHDFQDSLVLDVKDVKKIVTDEAQKGYDALENLADKKLNSKKAKKKGYGYSKTKLDDQALRMHRYLWGGQSCFIVDRIDVKKPNRWQYTTLDGEAVLIYTQKWNYVIAKAEMRIYFYIDPVTCSLKRMTQCMDGEVNIPFGYKLSEDELDILNALELPEDTLEKCKVRHAYASVKRNVLFNGVNEKVRHATEKNLQVGAVLVGSKKETLKYAAKAKAIVTKKL